MKTVPTTQENLPKPASRPRSLLNALWPLAVYALLTAIFTWPLVQNFGDRGISARSDDLWQNLWNLWWMKYSLFELHTNPFRTNLLFYPDSPSLYLHALNPLGGLLSVPFQLLFGLPIAHNLMVFLGFTLSAYATYWLARYLKLSSGAALLTGLIFAYSPILSSELDQGQLEQISPYYLPLFILFFLRALRSNTFSTSPPARFWQRLSQPRAFWRDTLLAAFFLLCTALTTWYYALDLIIFATLAALVYLYYALQQRDSALFLRLLGLALACSLFLAPLVYLTARAAARTPTAAARSSSVRYNSASLFNFFLPGDSRLWFTGPIEGQDFYYFLGYVAIILAIVALFKTWPSARGWFFILLFFLLFALGPQFKTGPDSYLDLPLPGALLQNLPVVGTFFRVPVRLVAFAMLPLGILAGLGLDWLRANLLPRFRRFPWANVALATLTIALVFLEYLPGPRQTQNLALDQSAWQQIQPPGAVLNLPYEQTGGGLPMYEQTAHHQPIIGGYLARLPGFDFLDQAPIIRELTHTDFKPSSPDFVSNDFAATLLPALNVYGVRYIVIHRDRLNSRQSAALDQTLKPALGGHPPLAQDGPIEIYRVLDYTWNGPPLPAWFDRGQGWYEEESSPTLGTYRWAEQEATLTLLNPNPQPVRYRLEWTLFSYHQTYPVQLTLNGYSIGQKDATPAAQPQAFELQLPPGRSTLTLKTTLPALHPNEVDPTNRDARALSFALAHLRLTAL